MQTNSRRSINVIIGLHHLQGIRKRPIVKDLSRSVCLSIWLSACLSVHVSVGHNREPYRNGWTDRGAVWGVDSGGPRVPRGRGNLVRHLPVHCKGYGMSCVRSIFSTLFGGSRQRCGLPDKRLVQLSKSVLPLQLKNPELVLYYIMCRWRNSNTAKTLLR